jgi:hypothetical protein
VQSAVKGGDTPRHRFFHNIFTLHNIIGVKGAFDVIEFGLDAVLLKFLGYSIPSSRRQSY